MPGCNHCSSDEAAKSSANNPGFRKVLWIALISNAAMFLIEVGASWSAGSVSLLADSLDFGGDAANYALSLFVLGMALQTRAKAALLKGISMGLDAIGNLAVLCAALLVGVTQTAWPDLAVAALMATLGLTASVSVIGQARAELRGEAPAADPHSHGHSH